MCEPGCALGRGKIKLADVCPTEAGLKASFPEQDKKVGLGYVLMWREAVGHRVGTSLGLDAVKCSLRSQICLCLLIR